LGSRTYHWKESSRDLGQTGYPHCIRRGHDDGATPPSVIQQSGE
jgi:hypothetical protein